MHSITRLREKKSPGADRSSPLECQKGLAKSLVLVQTRPAFVAAAATNRSALTSFHRRGHEKLIGGELPIATRRRRSATTPEPVPAVPVDRPSQCWPPRPLPARPTAAIDLPPARPASRSQSDPPDRFDPDLRKSSAPYGRPLRVPSGRTVPESLDSARVDSSTTAAATVPESPAVRSAPAIRLPVRSCSASGPRS